MTIQSFQNHLPKVDSTVFIEESARVIGDVVIGAYTSIWFNCVIRGDVAPIKIGSETNIQDLCCLHGTRGRYSVTIGNRVTVGHHAMLHGCQVDDLCLIGMGAILLDGVVVEKECLIAAGSLVTPGMHVPQGSMVMGSPAKVTRALSDKEREMISQSAVNYLSYANAYR